MGHCPVGNDRELKRKIAVERGLDCDQFRPTFFLRRVQVRLRHTNQATLGEYIRLADRDAEEFARLLEALSIPATEFFRDDSTFHLIRTRLLPLILAQRAGAPRRTVRVWSAGCATGQETYSLAILLAEALERHPTGILARVYGTDIDAGAVTYARRGIYARTEMHGVGRADALRHFVTDDNSRVAPAVRQLVRFRVHDLLKDPPLRHVDLLVCRNVLIYFSSSREVRRRVFDVFDAALRPGGFLILGKMDRVGPEAKRSFVPFDIGEGVYQKVRPSTVPRGGL